MTICLVDTTRASKVRREQIYQMLTEGGNPTLNSLQKILHALGLRLSVELEGIPTASQIPSPGATVGQESSAHTATF